MSICQPLVWLYTFCQRDMIQLYIPVILHIPLYSYLYIVFAELDVYMLWSSEVSTCVPNATLSWTLEALTLPTKLPRFSLNYFKRHIMSSHGRIMCCPVSEACFKSCSWTHLACSTSLDANVPWLTACFDTIYYQFLIFATVHQSKLPSFDMTHTHIKLLAG